MASSICLLCFMVCSFHFFLCSPILIAVKSPYLSALFKFSPILNFLKGFNEMNQTHLRNIPSFFAGPFLNKSTSTLLLCGEYKMVEHRVWGKDLVFSVPNKGRAKMRDKMNEVKKEKEQQMRFKNTEVVIAYFKCDRSTEVCLQSLENVPCHFEPTTSRSLRKKLNLCWEPQRKVCVCSSAYWGWGVVEGSLAVGLHEYGWVSHATAWLNLTKHRCLSRGP